MPQLPIVFDSTLAPADQFRIATGLVLRNPVSLALFVSGPLLWTLGASLGSVAVIELGERMSWLVPLVPAFAALVGSYSAYRPGSSALYEKTRWSFAEDAIGIEQPQRVARAEWCEFVKWREAAGCLLLHTTAREFVAVAVRDIPEGRRDDLTALLAERLGPKRG